MKLVIVESPAKSKTISHYLGDEYKVEASIGHICDLATTGKGGLGVDVDNGFKARYVINKEKRSTVKKLKDLSKKADEVILATDPDREGEAIAYHLANTLELDLANTKRLEFHEITKPSILHAIENPRTVDLNLVHSQEARRIIDRIIGFKLSTLLKSRIKSTSAGRVQSVTLKLICDHEKTIKNFVPEEYYEIKSAILKDGDELALELKGVDDKTVSLKTLEEANEILKRCGKEASVKDIKVSTRKVAAKEPFRTSTLQQEAFSKYGFKTSVTSSIAQKLYEGVELKDEGLVGLITYMRTDSIKLSDAFVENAKNYILTRFGNDYLKSEPRKEKKVNMAQDAHEAIRPTSLERTPESIRKDLKDNEYKLYKLIYNRTLASLMSDKKIQSEQIIFESNGVAFKFEQSKELFDGYNVLKIDNGVSKKLYNFGLGEVYPFVKNEAEQNFTKAPARFSEAKVVKLMEDEGIGRPSTYSSTIQTLIERKYIVSEKGIITPTEQGEKTAFVLEKYFPDLMNTHYTAEMEVQLDKISVGEEEEVQVLTEFYKPFITHFEEVKKKMYKDEPEYTGENCPECGNPLIVKSSKYGKFVACSNYPNCHYIKKEEKAPLELVGRDCPTCGKPLVYRISRRGQKFIGCSGYPNCNYIEAIQEETRVCPKCGSKLVMRRGKRGSFYGCSNYPECNYMESIKAKKE